MGLKGLSDLLTPGKLTEEMLGLGEKAAKLKALTEIYREGFAELRRKLKP